jgi:hypothetical protein
LQGTDYKPAPGSGGAFDERMQFDFIVVKVKMRVRVKFWKGPINFLQFGRNQFAFDPRSPMLYQAGRPLRFVPRAFAPQAIPFFMFPAPFMKSGKSEILRDRSGKRETAAESNMFAVADPDFQLFFFPGQRQVAMVFSYRRYAPLSCS